MCLCGYISAMAFTYYQVLLLCGCVSVDVLSVGYGALLVNNEVERLDDPDSSADSPRVVDEPVCNLCLGQCQVEDYPGCKCDAMCELYDDCCIDSPQCEPSIGYPNIGGHLFTLMECNTLYQGLFSSVYLETYWMVSRCSKQLGVDEIVDFQCATGSVTPVSDEETGIIYKNEYCAVCNSANSTIQWPFAYTCKEGFRHLLNFQSVDLDSFFENCSPCRYVIPTSLYNNSASSVHQPRSCAVHTSTCLTYMDYIQRVDVDSLLSRDRFENAVYYCNTGPYSLINALVLNNGEHEWTLYRNAHCALCNGADIHAPDSGHCAEFSDSDLCFLSSIELSTSYGRPRPTFSVLLDINRDGATTISTMETVTSATALQIACNENEVFDPAAAICREIICPPRYTVNKGSCVQIFRNSDQTRTFVSGLGDVGSVSPNPNRTTDINIPGSETSASTLQELADIGHMLVTTVTLPTDDSTTTSLCSLVTLMKGRDNLIVVGNDSVIFEGTQFTIVSFDDFQNPVICTSLYSFNNSSLLAHSQRIKQIVPGLFIIPSLTVYVIVLSLQILLRKLHSVYGIVIMNLALAMISSDIFLWSTFSSTISLGSLYFLWHACSLAVASWLCVLIVNIILSFRKRHNRPTIGASFRQKATLVCLYFIFGWGVPIIAALINNEVHGSWHPCINDYFSFCGSITSIVSFIIIPVTIATAFCLLICIAFCIKSIISPESLDKKISHSFYFFMILVFTFALKWMFGFIYLLSPSLLTSTITFCVFLFLRLVGVLVFFFLFVFTKRLRHTFQQSVIIFCHQRNRVRPLAQKMKQSSKTGAKPITSSAVKQQDSLETGSPVVLV